MFRRDCVCFWTQKLHNVQHMRTTHDAESIVRLLGFHRQQSGALDDRISILFRRKSIGQHTKNYFKFKSIFEMVFNYFLTSK